MKAAAGIEGGVAVRAMGSTVEVFTDGNLRTARSAQNGSFIELFFWPNRVMPAAKCLVAFEAWKVLSAAIEADGNPVIFRMIMPAAGFEIDIQSGH